MKLAVIGKVTDIIAISGADRIWQAVVVCGDAGKWCGVVGNDVECGERVTVFLPDAVLPPSDRWAFMERHKWRVRMARFKGAPSECLIVKGAPAMPIGTDLTEALGVTKHHKPIPIGMTGEMAGAFPSFIHKTDEPNFQTVPELVERMHREPWYATEKADGTSCTVWNDDAGMHVCSRNWELREFNAHGAGNAYWRVARKYGMDRLPLNLALQFEIVGPGIQGNPMGLKELEARAFTLQSVQYRGDTRNCPYYELVSACATLGVPMARVVGNEESLAEHASHINGRGMLIFTEDGLRKLAESVTYPNGKSAEGIVIRARNSRWSFKVLNLLYKF